VVVVGGIMLIRSLILVVDAVAGATVR